MNKTLAFLLMGGGVLLLLLHKQQSTSQRQTDLNYLLTQTGSSEWSTIQDKLSTMTDSEIHTLYLMAYDTKTTGTAPADLVSQVQAIFLKYGIVAT